MCTLCSVCRFYRHSSRRKIIPSTYIIRTIKLHQKFCPIITNEKLQKQHSKQNRNKQYLFMKYSDQSRANPGPQAACGTSQFYVARG